MTPEGKKGTPSGGVRARAEDLARLLRCHFLEDAIATDEEKLRVGRCLRRGDIGKRNEASR